MIVVVLDTNTLVSGFGWSGPPSVIVDAVLAGELLLVSSVALLDELDRVLRYPKLARVFLDPAEIIERVRAIAEVVEPGTTLSVVADEPDNRILEAAAEARVDAIVTGDAGLLDLFELRRHPCHVPGGLCEALPRRRGMSTRPG